MQVQGLGHVNIRTPDFQATLDFYQNCLGLVAGPAASANGRPQNAWLHDAAGRAIIHVNGPLPHEPIFPAGASSRLDHYALECVGLDACIDRLRAAGVPFERLRIEVRGLTQLNILDPNGIKVELTFVDAVERDRR